MADVEIPEAALAAACNLVWPHATCGCGPAVNNEGDVRKVLQAAAPYIGAAYLRRAADSYRDPNGLALRPVGVADELAGMAADTEQEADRA